MKKHPILLLVAVCAAGLTAQQPVTGTVSDENRGALAGATVAAKGTNSGTTTGTDGTFSLMVPAGAAVL